MARHRHLSRKQVAFLFASGKLKRTGKSKRMKNPIAKKRKKRRR